MRQSNTECRKSLKIEGIGLLNAIYLYIHIANEELGESLSSANLLHKKCRISSPLQANQNMVEKVMFLIYTSRLPP